MSVLCYFVNKKFRVLQFVQIELAYRSYLKVAESVAKLDLNDSIQQLESVKVNLLDEIKYIINPTKFILDKKQEQIDEERYGNSNTVEVTDGKDQYGSLDTE